MPEDSSLVTYVNLSNQYSRRRNHDSAFFFADRAIKISERLDKRRTLALRQLSYAYLMKNSMDTSRMIMRRGLTLAEQEGDSLNTCWFYTQMATTFLYNEYDSAIFYAMKAMPLTVKLQQKLANLRTLALAHFYSKDLDKAIVIQKEATALVQGKPENVQLSVYDNLAGFYYYAKRYDSASLIYQKIYTIHKQVGNHFNELKTLGNMATVEFGLGNYEKALKINEQIIRDSRVYQLDDEIRQSPMFNLGVNYRFLGDYQKARNYYDSAWLISSRYKKLNVLQDILEERLIIDSLMGDDRSMIMDLKRKIAFTDSVDQVTRTEQIEELKTQYETEKKDTEIASLSQQAQIQALELSQRNTQLVVAGVALLLVVLAGFLFYQQRKYKHQQAVSDIEQRMLRLQMNPHFIFNALSSIQNYILQSDTKESVKYLAKFGKLMRQILEHSREEFITIEEEVDMLTNYLQIQQLRFGGAFDYQIKVSEELDQSAVKIPPLFAQPLVENAIEHGLAGIEDGLVTISFSKTDNGVSLQVSDNGRGMNVQSKPISEHKSLASVITRERLDILSSRFKTRFTINFQSQKELGTSVHLIIPYSD